MIIKQNVDFYSIDLFNRSITIQYGEVPGSEQLITVMLCPVIQLLQAQLAVPVLQRYRYQMQID